MSGNSTKANKNATPAAEPGDRTTPEPFEAGEPSSALPAGPALRVVPDPDAGLPPVPEPADPGSLAGYASLLEAAEGRAGRTAAASTISCGGTPSDLWMRGEQAAAKERNDQAADVWMERLDADARAAEAIDAYLAEHPAAVPMLRDALRWHRAGWAPLPVKLDGSKAPLVAEWRQYHGAGNGPPEEQVREWFA